ncbi:MAG: metal ABC transporter substrate-binding protein [Chloroflexales bacterium]|nr:metal ABC transporter substrate-binding protein [Chloroflexales bacterium]
MHRLSVHLGLITLAALLLASCGASQSASQAPTAAAPAPSAASEAPTAAAEAPTTAPQAGATQAPAASGEKIKVRLGVFPTPAGEIAAFVRDNLAAQEGLELELLELTDGVQLNRGVVDQQLDANLFQHKPYLDDFLTKNNLQLSVVAPVFYIRLGIYSKNVASVAEVPDGGKVTIPVDPSNGSRALRLLEANGLITIKPEVTGLVKVTDIAENPKHLEIIELEGAQIPRSLEDTSIAVINGNIALNAGLNPNKDALVLEAPEVGLKGGLAVIIVTAPGHEQDPGIVRLVKAFHRPEVKQFIEQKYNGVVYFVAG